MIFRVFQYRVGSGIEKIPGSGSGSGTRWALAEIKMMVRIHLKETCEVMLELFGATRSMKKNKVSHSEMHFRV